MKRGLDEKSDKKEPESFFTVTGKKIRSLRELRDFLNKADEKEFSHHVTDKRNDFENWVRNSLRNKELADLIRGKKTQDAIIRVIDYYLKKEALENPESRFLKEGIPKTKWVKTDIPGFDDLITNGIPQGSAVLICGGPGTGKTTFCLHLANNAAVKGEKCLYLTFEEDVINLKRHMKNYSWDPVKLEKEGKMVIKKMQPFDLSRSVEALLAKASGELTIELDEIEGIIPKDFKPDRIILDSLSAVAAAFTDKEEGYRVYIEQLFSLFKRIGATSFLVTEIEQETSKYSRSGIEEFLADAVFVFYNIRNKNVRLNALEILKIRGTSHQKKIVPFRMLSNKGIIVYPLEEAFT